MLATEIETTLLCLSKISARRGQWYAALMLFRLDTYGPFAYISTPQKNSINYRVRALFPQYWFRSSLQVISDRIGMQTRQGV